MCSSEAPASRALVDDQVQVGGLAGVGAHPLAPGLDRDGDALVVELRERRSRAAGELTITSCAPAAGCEPKRSGSPVRREACSGSVDSRSGPTTLIGRRRARSCPDPRRAPGRGSGPSACASPGVSGAPPPGRFAQTSGGVRSSRPSQKGQRSARLAASCCRRGSERVGALGAAGGEHRPQPVSWSIRISGRLRTRAGGRRRRGGVLVDRRASGTAADRPHRSGTSAAGRSARHARRARARAAA